MKIGFDYATKGTNKVDGQARINSRSKTTPTTRPPPRLISRASWARATRSSAAPVTRASLTSSPRWRSEQGALYLWCSGRRHDHRHQSLHVPLGASDYQDVQTATSYVKALGTGKTVLVLAQDYAFGQSYVTDATAAFTALGDTVTSDLVPLTTTDFTPVALQVAQDNPDIVFLAWAGTTGAPLAQALDQAGVFASSHVITGLANIATYPFYGTAGLKFNYISLYTYQSPHNSVNNFLIEQMNKRYHTVPDLFTADGFVWAEMVARAIATGGGTHVNEMIKGLQGWTFQAPKGTQTIRASDHAMLQPMFQVQLVQTVNGTYQPATLATISAQDTAPPVSAHFPSN